MERIEQTCTLTLRPAFLSLVRRRSTGKQPQLVLQNECAFLEYIVPLVQKALNLTTSFANYNPSCSQNVLMYCFNGSVNNVLFFLVRNKIP